MNALEVENEVSARCDIAELEFSLCLLNFLESVLNKHLVLLLQVCEYLDVELIRLLFYLHFSQRRRRYLPLHLLKLYVPRDLIKCCLRIDNPACSKHNKSCLCGSESVLF